MNMNLDFIKTILKEHKEGLNLFKRNLIKEYLQILILSFIYNHPKYQKLIFYGGSCLRHCFDFPRFSEDLDFVDLEKKIKLKELAKDLKIFFRKELDLEIYPKIQKFRIYLKFPILHHLKLTKKGESNYLFVKVEIFSNFNFCKNFKIEIVPLFKFGKPFLVRTFDLPTLMATKIVAIFSRKWEKINKKGKILAKVKGRDYFDLLWYLNKKVEPNLKCLKETLTKEELKRRLSEIVEKVDSKSLRFDLEGLIEDRNYVKNLSKNLKEILLKEIEKI